MNIGRSSVGLLLALSLTLPSFACSIDGTSGIVPENDLSIPVDAKNVSGISEQDFISVIQEAATIYAPVIARQGAQLKIRYNWASSQVNANAIPEGNLRVINLFGGLARHPQMTKDAYALVLCHELGHHLGGAPKKTERGSTWASSEGQADYFATLKCLRRMFLNDDNRAALRGQQFPKALLDSCKASWPSSSDFLICVRSGMAGLAAAKTFQAIVKADTPPAFHTPSRLVVAATNLNDYPDYQCRLDTFYQGALCQVDETVELSNADARQGTCHQLNGHRSGNRPSCWYKAR